MSRLNSRSSSEEKKKQEKEMRNKKEGEDGDDDVELVQRGHSSEKSHETKYNRHHHHHHQHQREQQEKMERENVPNIRSKSDTTTTTGTTGTTGYSGGGDITAGAATADVAKRSKPRRVAKSVARQLGEPQHDADGNFIPAKFRSNEAKETKYRVVKHKVFCKVDDCGLECVSLYSIRVKVCVLHLKKESVKVSGVDSRFCQKCTKFHEVSAFRGDKRACIASLTKLANVRSKATASVEKAVKMYERITKEKTKTTSDPLGQSESLGCGSVDQDIEMKKRRRNKQDNDAEQGQQRKRPTPHGNFQKDRGFSSRTFRMETAKKMLGNLPSQEDVDPLKEAQEKRRKEIIDSLYKQSG